MKQENELNTNINIVLEEGTKELTNKRRRTAIEQSKQINVIDNLKLFFACNKHQENTGSPVLPLDIMGEIVKFTFPLEDIPKFLKLVVEGEQDQAEAMLKENPALSLCASNVTDLSGRTFNNITGFQYAVWALDWHMWKMILRDYLPTDQARVQVQGLETGSWVAQHGKSASWQNLIDALDIFIDMCNKSQWDAATNQWNGAVGNAQQQLPVHVVNQYCHPNRSFKPCPNFQEESSLPRSRQTNRGDWFTCEYNGDKLGKNCFAFCRGGGAVSVMSDLVYSVSAQAALVRYMTFQTQLSNQLLADINKQDHRLTM